MRTFKKVLITGLVLAIPAGLFAFGMHNGEAIGNNHHGDSKHYKDDGHTTHQNGHYKGDGHGHKFEKSLTNGKHYKGDGHTNHILNHTTDENHVQNEGVHEDPKSHVLPKK